MRQMAEEAFRLSFRPKKGIQKQGFWDAKKGNCLSARLALKQGLAYARDSRQNR
jgi:hypothetical protein